jgi:hypothetical protein
MKVLRLIALDKSDLVSMSCISIDVLLLQDNVPICERLRLACMLLPGAVRQEGSRDREHRGTEGCWYSLKVVVGYDAKDLMRIPERDKQ